ncbi:PREDICTED: uncharacterized protein LOC104802095 [Tarenaya hassleriana]|uniref:uncharacterized protein LOC104802095 n=1 Tax=Tarenaya hassleriana TaxID=28532 RepID=UPI00053C0CD2|nr:PREDICTED: uncharacterized protein LOC104802095 [Tarenaya hassleriana]
MGNCVGGSRILYTDKEDEVLIRVVTPDGGVMELHPPITAESITNEFSGHAVYLRRSSPPLHHHEELLPGNNYSLLPLSSADRPPAIQTTPYRMSNAGKTPAATAWKVRLVISPEQLAEILEHDAKTEALIESVRTVAKCAGGYGGAYSASVADSDQWSVTSNNRKRPSR